MVFIISLKWVKCEPKFIEIFCSEIYLKYTSRLTTYTSNNCIKKCRVLQRFAEVLEVKETLNCTFKLLCCYLQSNYATRKYIFIFIVRDRCFYNYVALMTFVPPRIRVHSNFPDGKDISYVTKPFYVDVLRNANHRALFHIFFARILTKLLQRAMEWNDERQFRLRPVALLL